MLVCVCGTFCLLVFIFTYLHLPPRFSANEVTLCHIVTSFAYLTESVSHMQIKVCFYIYISKCEVGHHYTIPALLKKSWLFVKSLARAFSYLT